MTSRMQHNKLLGVIFIFSFWATGTAAPENCFNEIYSYSGHITSFNYPQPYLSGRNCTWIISTLSIYRFQLTFLAFDLELHKSCKYDYVIVYDGASTEDKVLGKFCGQSMPKPLISSKNVVRINFNTDSRVERTGFNLTYNSAMCGSNFHQREGSFDSPHYPDNYPGYKRCIWTIETSDNLQVSLDLINIIQFSNSSSCTEEYLRIFGFASTDNELSGSPFLPQTPSIVVPLAFICRKKEVCELQHSLSDLRSSSNKIILMYVSECPAQGIRFKAHFTSVPCGGVFEKDEGILSVAYPENHMKNADCVWTIKVSKGQQVVLHSTSLQILQTPNCTTDYLEIRDGLNESSPLLKDRTCGTNIDKSIRSTSNTMLVRFKSSASSNARGFIAKFTADINECETGVDLCAHNCVNSNEGYSCTCKEGYVLNPDGYNCSVPCGGAFEKDEGTLSVAYPENYMTDANCVWTIKVSEGYQVVLHSIILQVMQTPNCNTDYLEIRAGLNESSPLLENHICDTNIDKSIRSTSNTMRIRFKSNASSNAREVRRFTAIFAADIDECKIGVDLCTHNCVNTLEGYICTCKEGYILHDDNQSCMAVCGGAIRRDEGILQSLNYPDEYLPNQNCTWTVTVASGYKVSLIFDAIEIEEYDGCAYDYVEVRDGTSLASPLLARLCGTRIPDMIRTSSNSMLVRFSSDGSVNKRGFSAKFHS